jgi:C1A family cysteine protease
MIPLKTAGYGWRQSIPDPRDDHFEMKAGIVPDKISIRLPPAYTQRQTGSCVLNALAALVQRQRFDQKFHDFIPSRLQMYFDARELEGTTDQDAGCMPRNAMKAMASKGAVSEEHWPFREDLLKMRPPAEVYDMAHYDVALEYRKVLQSEADFTTALAAGHSILFGTSIFQEFESGAVAQTGTVPMPRGGPIAGHGMAICGYDYNYDMTKRNRCWEVHNSWGVNWGASCVDMYGQQQRGHCFFPFDYLLDPDIARDFWIVQLVGKAK